MISASSIAPAFLIFRRASPQISFHLAFCFLPRSEKFRARNSNRFDFRELRWRKIFKLSINHHSTTRRTTITRTDILSFVVFIFTLVHINTSGLTIIHFALLFSRTTIHWLNDTENSIKSTETISKFSNPIPIFIFN